MYATIIIFIILHSGMYATIIRFIILHTGMLCMYMLQYMYSTCTEYGVMYL